MSEERDPFAAVRNTYDELWVYDPRWVGGELSQEEILRLFQVAGAAWMHDGDPGKPHAELTSGKCSNGFFNCQLVLEIPNLCEILARELARNILKVIRGPWNWGEFWVIGSPYAAITFSYEVAKRLSAVHGFAEKDPADPTGKRMVWRRRTIPRGSKVLQIEELITTSGTFREVRRAIQEGNEEPVDFYPVVGTLVHRPPKLPADYGDVKVVALVEKEVWAVDPPCDLCKAGSRRYRPKTHWKELTGKG